MITVISGTNRPGNRTKVVAKHCFNIIREKGLEVNWLDLEDIQGDILSSEMYVDTQQHPEISRLQDEMIIPSDLLLIVSPEYNGSFPGVLKSFIDALSVRKYQSTFKGKRAALIGVASGRAGNLRGMDHLTGVLNYLNVVVMPNKLPVSSVSNYIDSDVINSSLDDLLNQFINEALVFSNIGNEVVGNL